MSKGYIIFSSLRILAKKPAYVLYTLVLSILFFLLYIIINSYFVFISAIKINPGLFFEVFINQVRLIWGISGPLNIMAIAAVSIIAGLNLSLTLLRIRNTKVFIGRTNLFSLVGISAGSFGASCSACTTSLIAILGVSGGLAVFPLRGLEFLLLAFTILAVSLYFTSKSLVETGIIS